MLKIRKVTKVGIPYDGQAVYRKADGVRLAHWAVRFSEATKIFGEAENKLVDIFTQNVRPSPQPASGRFSTNVKPILRQNASQ